MRPGPDTEFAWAAGLFDGEGSTCPAGRRRADGHRPSIRMVLSQKDTGPELLLRFHVAVGYGVVSERGDRPGVWTWRCIGLDCLNVLQQLWPYLSTPKKLQANAVIAGIKEARRTAPSWVVKRQGWNREST